MRHPARDRFGPSWTAVLAALVLAAPAASATDHAGTCAGVFAAADNPHRLTSTCTVPAGQTLTLPAGVTFDGQNNVLEVQGTLQATNVTITNMRVHFATGSGGSITGSTLVRTSSVGYPLILVSGSSVTTPVTPVIDGNTLTYSAGSQAAIQIDGTGRPTITNNTITTHQRGIWYRDQAAGTASGNTISFVAEGSNGRAGIRIDGDASPTITGNTITNDATRSDIALDLSQLGPASGAQVSANSVCLTGNDVAVDLSPGYFATGSAADVQTNAYPCGSPRARIAGGTFGTSSALRSVEGTSAFDVIGTLTVAAGQQLVVGAGFTLSGANNVMDVAGTLQATGASFTDLRIQFAAGSGGSIRESTLVRNSSVGYPLLLVGGTSTTTRVAPTIADNTMVYLAGSQAAVQIEGTATPAIAGNAILTHRRGLWYRGTAGGTATGNTITFEAEGGSGRVAVEVDEAASPAIRDNVIEDDPTRTDTAFDLGQLGATSALQVTENSVCASGSDVPIELGANYFAAGSTAVIADNVYPCSVAGHVRLDTSTLTGNALLRAVESTTTLELTGTVTVAAGTQLTIPPGMTITGGNGQLEVQGTLQATEAGFTNVRIHFGAGSGGEVRGCTLTRDASVGYPLIQIDGTSTTAPIAPIIADNTFHYLAGSQAAIHIDGTARPTITGNTIVTDYRGLWYMDRAGGTATTNTIRFVTEGNGNRSGIQVDAAASPELRANTIADDPTRTDTALYLRQISAASTVQITENAICTTGSDVTADLGPAYFATVAGATIDANTYPCASAPRFRITGGTLTLDAAFEPVDGSAALEMGGSVTVDQGKALTIPPGLTLTGPNGNLEIQGTLSATGATFRNMRIRFAAGSTGSVRECHLQQTVSFGQALIDVSGTSTVAPVTPIIADNTLEYLAGGWAAIYVDGTARPSITGNTITTDQRALWYRDRSGGTAQGNLMRFRLAGSSGRTAVQIDEDASPTVRGNTLADDPDANDVGISLAQAGGGSGALVTENAICVTGGDIPIDLGTAFFTEGAGATVTDNDFTCGLAAGFRVRGGQLTGAATLRAVDGQTTFDTSSTITIGADESLTVPTGLTLESTSSSIVVQEDGRFDAAGATFRNVFVTFQSGSAGTLQDCRLTAGSFQTLVTVTEASPALVRTEFEAPGTGVSVSGGNPVFVGNVFRSLSTAVSLGGTTAATFTDNLFDANATALRVQGPASRSTASGNVLRRNGVAVSFDTANAMFSAFPTGWTASTFDGPFDKNVVALPTTLDVSGTLPTSPVAYVASSMYVPAGRTLIIDPGTVIRFQSGGVLTADGDLVALGTPTSPIVFTALNAKAGGRWSGIRVNNKAATSQSALRSTIIEYAGFDAGIALTDASITVADNLITGGNTGIRVSGTTATPLLTGNAIVQNTGYGVTTQGGARPQVARNSILGNAQQGFARFDCPAPGNLLDARNNYWGDDSGPRDPSDDRAGGGLFNPGGFGDDVTNCVGYAPWTTFAPTVSGHLAAVGGGGQTAPVGTCLLQPLVIEVSSSSGALLSDIDVTFAVATGDADIQTTQPVRTGVDGRAAAVVCLGLVPGEVVVTATARDVNSPLALFTVAGSGGVAPAFALEATPLHLDVVPGHPGQPGDGDGDGELTNGDAVTIGDPDVPPPPHADVNDDGTVDESDARVIEGYVTGAVPARVHRRRRAARMHPRSGRVRVLYGVPTEEVAPGDRVVVPIHLEDGEAAVLGYALEIRWDRRALRVLDVAGGTFAGFEAPPVANVGRGRLVLTARNAGRLATPGSFRVATVTFEVLDRPGDTRIRVRRARRGRMVLAGERHPAAVAILRTNDVLAVR